MGNTLRRFYMEQSELRICFFGPSGSGKSTCFGFAEDAIHERVDKKLQVVRADVARPLREAQWSVYLKMGLIPPYDMTTKPDQMPQDGKLLAFLASHFQNHLGPACASYVAEMSDGCNRRAAFVNTDCRNNAYGALHDAGFWFVRVMTEERLVRERLAERGDITPYDLQSEVERTDEIKPHFTVQNDGTLDDLRESVNCAVQVAIFKREEFLSA